MLALVLWGALKAFQRLPQLSAWRVPLGIAAAAIVALTAVWKVPEWQVGKVSGLEPKERFDRVNEARKTLAQIVGGLAVLAGFYSTVQNLKVTQDNQALAQKSFALAQEGQITDRFTKAIEQLGAVNSKGEKRMEVRLGGIFALQRIANESNEEHWPIMEVLSAYIRDNAHRKKQQQPEGLSLATDIQACLTVLRTRNTESEHENQVLNLLETDLRGADLHGANLRGAELSEADVSEANLRGANLTAAELVNHTNLHNADLRQARLDGAHLNEADLGFAELQGAHLDGAYLSDANLILAGLKGAYLTKAHLSGANLSEADLTGAYLNEAHLGSAHLKDADLSGADLRGAHASFADLSGVLLNGANLSGMHLGRANLDGANLTGADLSGADLTKVKNLEQQQIDSAKGDGNTKLPSNLHMPEAWKSVHK